MLVGLIPGRIDAEGKLYNHFSSLVGGVRLYIASKNEKNHQHVPEYVEEPLPSLFSRVFVSSLPLLARQIVMLYVRSKRSANVNDFAPPPKDPINKRPHYVLQWAIPQQTGFWVCDLLGASGTSRQASDKLDTKSEQALEIKPALEFCGRHYSWWHAEREMRG